MGEHGDLDAENAADPHRTGKRVDTDGRPYTYEQFVEFHGEYKAKLRWAEAPREGETTPVNAWGHSMRAKILHWTGPRRKPWLHWLPLARTPFDNLWWAEHKALCSSIESGTVEASHQASHLRQPCRIHCS